LAGAFDTSYNGGANDAFVAEVNADATALTYAAFLGGNGDDYGYGIAVDGQQNAYVTGYTWSSDFPTTANALDPSLGGYLDAFVTKLSMPTLLDIGQAAPAMARPGAPITYTLTVTNATGQTVTNLRITDTLPVSANYVSGGTRSGDVVTWAVASLAADSSTSVQLVVTATQTITHDDYRAAADGHLSAVGEVPAVTTIGQPVTKYYYFGSTRASVRPASAARRDCHAPQRCGILPARRPSPSASVRTILRAEPQDEASARPP
jgi:uncharacterized repeat protein (TIGR01451 family)